jgi:hypothetical protein
MHRCVVQQQAAAELRGAADLCECNDEVTEADRLADLCADLCGVIVGKRVAVDVEAREAAGPVLVPDAAGYFSYFGSAAGDPARGYYSFDLGTWHIVALNSNCAYVGGCHAGSPQEQWLRADLAAHPAKCTLAFWHHPLFSSGKFGAWEGMAPFWQALYDAGAEIVLSGHDHNYERFAPQDAAGKADSGRGIVQYVVGTGGKELTELLAPMANSIVRDNLTYGVLEIRLGTGQYQWSFTPAAGGTFSDSGSATCH